MVLAVIVVWHVTPDPALGIIMAASSKGLHRVTCRLLLVVTTNSASKPAKEAQGCSYIPFHSPWKKKNHRLKEIHDTFKVLEDGLQIVRSK